MSLDSALRSTDGIPKVRFAWRRLQQGVSRPFAGVFHSSFHTDRNTYELLPISAESRETTPKQRHHSRNIVMLFTLLSLLLIGGVGAGFLKSTNLARRLNLAQTEIGQRLISHPGNLPLLRDATVEVLADGLSCGDFTSVHLVKVRFACGFQFVLYILPLVPSHISVHFKMIYIALRDGILVPAHYHLWHNFNSTLHSTDL